jgi:hypothetical protein
MSKIGQIYVVCWAWILSVCVCVSKMKTYLWKDGVHLFDINNFKMLVNLILLENI